MHDINILLADDDLADCLLFREALADLPVSACLTIVHNGEQVIERLTQKGNTLPDVLFLDLNMPLKNGYATLGEIKRHSEIYELPVIIFTTSTDAGTIKKVFRDAAHYFISKPVDFVQLKKVIYEGLTLIQNNNSLSSKEKFIISGASVIIPDQNES